MIMTSFEEFLEAFKIKVNFHGEKRKKLKCPPGYQPNSEGTACVPQTAQHKHDLKIGAKHATLTKKSEGDSLRKMTAKKTKKAMKFRQRLGL